MEEGRKVRNAADNWAVLEAAAYSPDDHAESLIASAASEKPPDTLMS
jgi:hypothetical protein